MQLNINIQLEIFKEISVTVFFRTVCKLKAAEVRWRGKKTLIIKRKWNSVCLLNLPVIQQLGIILKLILIQITNERQLTSLLF